MTAEIGPVNLAGIVESTAAATATTAKISTRMKSRSARSAC
ncbi:MAG: hypothetical protein WKF82_06315 [Nocardioidaceae bacterium]